MNLIISIYSAILFFVLSPGVLLRLPSNGNKYVVAAFHAILFGIILLFSSNISNILHLFNGNEGFKEGGPLAKMACKAAGGKRC
jgi:hypothetical protein